MVPKNNSSREKGYKEIHLKISTVYVLLFVRGKNAELWEPLLLTPIETGS